MTGRFLTLLVCCTSLIAGAQIPAVTPMLKGHRITQQDITSRAFDLNKIRLHGFRLFVTPFNKADGYGDGPMNHSNPMENGGRPTLQGNGTLLRVNGLDSQSCLECHSVLSSRSIPMRFAVGGHGTANNNVLTGGEFIDPGDRRGQGIASFNGRFINPPFVFGAGGIELLAKEMTVELQALKQHALANPGTTVPLVAKGVSFGRIRADEAGEIDLREVEGIEPDLVVRPFGRKGEFATTRAFDVGAMQFHQGMQPVEVVGENVDADGDGVSNELLIGELSALSVFNVTLTPPERRPTPGSLLGEPLFESVGCASCHVPYMDTATPGLGLSFPEVETEPGQNVFLTIDLSKPPASFPKAPQGGIRVHLFSDLKRHDMGAGLAEATRGPLDRFFVTPRLWGIADSGPYLHDGRALTLAEAIRLHGGEAQAARDAFVALPDADQKRLVRFLMSLRTPKQRPDLGLRLKDLEN